MVDTIRPEDEQAIADFLANGGSVQKVAPEAGRGQPILRLRSDIYDAVFSALSTMPEGSPVEFLATKQQAVTMGHQDRVVVQGTFQSLRPSDRKSGGSTGRKLREAVVTVDGQNFTVSLSQFRLSAE